MIDSAPTQVRSAKPIVNRYVFRDDTDILRAIDKDTVARQQLLRFIKVHHDFVEELAAPCNPVRRQVAGKSANTRVGGGKARTCQPLDQVINLFALRKR